MKIKVSKWYEFCFQFGYCCILIAFLFTCTTYPNNYEWINVLTRWLRILGYALCVYKLVAQYKSTRNKLIFFASVVIVAFIVALITDSELILTDILVIVSGAEANLKRIIEIDIRVRVLFLIFTLFSFFIGIIPEAIDYRNWQEIRHSYGFSHPNRMALHVFMICLYIFYLKHGKFKLLTFLLMMGALFAVYTITGGRTSCIGIATIILIELMYKIIGAKKISIILTKYGNILTTFTYFMCLVFSFGASVLYMLGIIKYNNSSTLLSRIALSANGLLNYGIKIFGQKIEIIGTLEAQRLGVQSNGIDNAFVYLAVNYGIIVFLIMMALLWIAMKRARKEKNEVAVICLMLILVLSILEAQLLYVESNLFLLYAGFAFVGVHKEHLKRELEDRRKI